MPRIPEIVSRGFRVVDKRGEIFRKQASFSAGTNSFRPDVYPILRFIDDPRLYAKAICEGYMRMDP